MAPDSARLDFWVQQIQGAIEFDFASLVLLGPLIILLSLCQNKLAPAVAQGASTADQAFKPRGTILKKVTTPPQEPFVLDISPASSSYSVQCFATSRHSRGWNDEAKHVASS